MRREKEEEDNHVRSSQEHFISLPYSKKASGRVKDPAPIEKNDQYIETKVKPNFGKILYSDIEDNDEKKTEFNDDLDEIDMNANDLNANDFAKGHPIEAEDLDKGKDFAKQKKKVLYSDKSESSVDEMMEDTPSNYNIPNGRLDGKSMGIKSILMFAKKQGIHLPQGHTPNQEKQA